MKAVVYGGPGEKTWTDVPDPEIQNSGDVTVKVEATTICGTDLHILKGDVPAVATAGVHGKSVEPHLEDLWVHNTNISMGLVNANTTPMLLKLVAQQKVPAEKFATHHFGFDQFIEAHDTFSRAAETKALKVVVTA